MSILISDTLKPRGDGVFPVAEAKDVHVDLDNIDLEKALEPATDIKLGRVKVGNNIDVDSDGKISIINRVTIDDNMPNDGSYLWLDSKNPIDIETEKEGEPSKIVKISQKENNSIELVDDGLFALDWHREKPSVNPYGWNYGLNDVMYYKGWALALTKSIDYYVSSDGDDVYGDGTAEHPRLTLAGVPRNLNGYGINIYVSGDYYSLKRDFNVNGFYGGRINIYMVGNPRFWRMQFFNNVARIYLRNAFTCSISGMSTSNLTGWTNAFMVSGCSLVYLTSDNSTAEATSVTITGNGTGSFTATTGQKNCRFRALLAETSGFFSDSRIKLTCKNAYQGVIVNAGCRAAIDRLYVANNTYGLAVGYSKFGCNKLTFTSNTNSYNIYGGGRYYSGSQSSFGRY